MLLFEELPHQLTDKFEIFHVINVWRDFPTAQITFLPLDRNTLSCRKLSLFKQQQEYCLNLSVTSSSKSCYLQISVVRLNARNIIHSSLSTNHPLGERLSRHQVCFSVPVSLPSYYSKLLCFLMLTGLEGKWGSGKKQSFYFS